MNAKSPPPAASLHKLRSQVTVQRILQEHWPDFAQRFPQPGFVHRAAYLLAHCRTAVLGGHVKRCPQGHVEQVHYNSCRHRACPACSSMPRAKWLERWKAKMLDTAAHHIVFTTPQELAPWWRLNKVLFAQALFLAAKDALLTLLADRQYQGALPGLLAALHTWSQTLAAHPHAHFIVTSGGLNEQGEWVRPKKACLLPRKVLMVMFRGKMLARLRELVSSNRLELPAGQSYSQCLSLLNRLGRATWNVKLLERYEHARGVAIYLANYLRGGPIGNQRLLSLRDGKVTFRYLDRRDGAVPRPAQTTMPVDSFLKLWAQHVPPAGLHTVRAYGLYASSHCDQLNLARAQLAQAAYDARQFAQIQRELATLQRAAASAERCPECGTPLVTEQLPRSTGARLWQAQSDAQRGNRLSLPPQSRSPPRALFTAAMAT